MTDSPSAHARASPSRQALTVSVVVPTFDRPGQLRECLAALSRQTLPAGQFEVVVVDDGSSGPLDHVVADVARTLSVRLVRQANVGPAVARNRGVREARGILVAFTDDDCRPTPAWLERLVAAAHRHPDAMVGGTTINGCVDDLFASTSQMIVDLVYEHYNAAPLDSRFFASNNMLCSRAEVLALGGFDPVFRRAGAEDRDFCDRWRTSGRRLVWEYGAIVDHRHPQTCRGFIELHYRYGRGARLYQVKRRARRSGRMGDELRFHRTLFRRVSRRLGARYGYGRSLQTAGALALWQVANLLGFAREALPARRQA